MSTRYFYNNSYYYTIDSLYRAIWKHERRLLRNVTTIEGFQSYGVSVSSELYDPLETVNLETLRSKLLEKLDTKLTEYRNNRDTAIESSLGFKANANITAYNNVDGVRLQAEQGSNTLSDGKVAFMDYDDNLQMLDAEQLAKLQLEISENGSRAYGVKWQARQAIEKAQTNKEMLEIFNQLEF